METTVNSQIIENISEGCNRHRFFRNKVFNGLNNEPLYRKRYRGKRLDNGKRINEVFYVDEKNSIRIDEELLIASLDEILEKLKNIDNTNVKGWNSKAANMHFQNRQKSFMRKEKITVLGYQHFIEKCIQERDYQCYENLKVKQKIKEENFKDIIEKIEVFETGIVCILTNGFEIALQFK